MDYECWYSKGDISPLKYVKPKKILCFDTETTGLNWDDNDEILQIGIVRGDGEVLFSDYIKPSFRKRWPKAQEIHGITPTMVKDKLTLIERLPELNEIFSQAELLVGYNMEFDLHFLLWGGVQIPNNALEFDVMKEYAPVAGDFDSYHLDFKYKKLGHCARHYGYKFNAHDAADDAKATLHCFYEMLDDEKPHHSKDKMTPYLRVVEINKEVIERKSRESSFESNSELKAPDPSSLVIAPPPPPDPSQRVNYPYVPQSSAQNTGQNINASIKKTGLFSRFFSR